MMTIDFYIFTHIPAKQCPHCESALRCVVDDGGVRYECKDYRFERSYRGVWVEMYCMYYGETGRAYTEPYDGLLDGAVMGKSPMDVWIEHGKVPISIHMD